MRSSDHTGVGSNQYATRPGAAAAHHRDGHDGAEAAAVAHLEDEPTEAEIEEIGDAFTLPPKAQQTWEWAFGGEGTPAQRDEAREAWEKSGVTTPAEARSITRRYEREGVPFTLVPAAHAAGVSPEVMGRWSANEFLRPDGRRGVEAIAAVDAYLRPDQVEDMIRRQKMPPVDRRCPAVPLVELMVGRPPENPALIRKVVQRLTGKSKREAAEVACEVRGRGQWWPDTGRDDWVRAARQPVWWRRWRHANGWSFGK